MFNTRRFNRRNVFQKSVTWMIIAIFFAQPILVSAETVADSNAAGKDRPVVENTANGTTIVQITAPSAAGVSRNQYSKFNVDTSGLILNNSTGITQTQLAGYVERNVSLGTAARVILNEVTSTNPTSLLGYIEVAGQKADVIVANPNGISGNGFGFINTSRAVLTTGTPVFGGSGSLDAFRVTGGQIAIEGTGLNASDADQVDLISRATTVNAGIWAKNLNVIAGANQVDYSTLAVQKITGDTNAPQVAIDVGALGGMYANKIFMVGTENGVGVKSEGILSATNGDLIVTSEGKVVLGNSTSANGNIQVTAKEGIKNTGTLYAQGNAELFAQGDIDNQAVLAAGENVVLSGNTISSTGTLGAGIQSDGSLGTTGNLIMQAQNTLAVNGQNLVAGDLSMTAGNLNLKNSSTYVGGDAVWTALAGDINHTGSTTQVGGTLTATAQGTISNSKNAAGTAGDIVTGQLNLTAKNIDNTDGTIAATQTATVQADSVTNTGGQLATNKDLNISAEKITGDGKLIAGQDLTLNVKQDFTNQASGVVQANNDLQITSDSAITNQGSLAAVGAMSVKGTNITNDTNGTIAAQNVALQTTGDVTNAGRIDGSDIQVTAQKSVKNTGKVFGDTLTITADRLTNQGENGVLASNVRTDLLVSGTAGSTESASIENKDGATIYSLGDIHIAANTPDTQTGQYTNKADSVLNQSATIEADGNISISANNITNKKREFELQSQTTTTTVSTDITPWSGYYKAKRNYTETSTQLVVVKDSDSGKIIAGKDMTLLGDIENNVSTITAGGTLSYDSNSLTNIGYSNNLQVVRSGTDTQTRSERYCSHSLWGKCIDHDWRDVAVSAPYYENTSTNLEGYNAIISANVIKGTGGKVENRTVTPTGSPVGSTVTTATKEFTFEVPESGLYTVHTESTAKYLVETDSQFTNYKSFLSSDYLLAKLSTDPSNVQKRLGDGFYEQRLVQEQILKETGNSYLEGYTSSEEQYKALMNNAVTEATQLNLTVGVALSAEQLASLKSDIVWMVEKEVDGQKVLVPVVYLASTSTSEVTTSGALISANAIEITETGTVTNSGVIKAKDNASITADTITNYGGTIESGGTTKLNATQDIVNQSGSIVGNEVNLSAGGNVKNETVVSTVSQGNVTTTLNDDQAVIKATTGELTIQAGQDISNNGAVMKAAGDVTLVAGGNVESSTVERTEHAAQQTGSSTYVRDSVTNQASTIEGGGNVTIAAQKDVTLKGTEVTSGDNLTLVAGGNVSIEAAKDSSMVDYSSTGKATYRRSMTDNETLVSSDLTAKNNVTVIATSSADAKAGNILIQGSNVTSTSGNITLDADKDVTIKEESVRKETLTQSKDKTEGFLSKKETESLDHTIDNTVGSSTLSGEQVTVQSGKDITVQGSNVVATNDVALQAANNITVTTAQETVEKESYYREKSSGISVSLSSSGASLFAGTTTNKTTSTEKDVEQVGSVIGSTDGKVTLEAQKDASITGSQISSKAGTTVTAENVDINSAESTAALQQTTESTKSGLSISVGNSTINSIGKASDEVTHATEVNDTRLKNLLAYQAARNTTDAVNNITDGKALSGVTISVGATKTEQTSQTIEKITTAEGSTVKSDGDIKIVATGSGKTDEQGKATDGNINVVGSTVSATNITLDAAKDINLTSAKNTTTTDTTTSSKSSGYGVDLTPTGAITDAYVSASKSNGTENADTTTHTETEITAQDTLTIKSGQDTSLLGAKAQGDTVVANVGGNLSLESQQDTDNYKANTTSIDGKITIGSTTSVSGSATKANTDSTYSSVVDQTSINAGKGGFDINVGSNTDLKGAVISSDATPDKNKISTDTLTYSDIQNKADYSASSTGVNINTSKDAKYNEKGVTPDIGIPASGDASSTTKSAIASGTVEVKSNPNQDISNLSRDTSGALNELGKIFDKKTVQEKQELAKVFGEEAYEEVHKISVANGWDEGSPQKIALHALVGGIMSDLGGSSFTSGAVGAGVNEAVQKQLSKITDPDLHQWASVVVGAAAAKTVGGSAQAGASTAASGTKNNILWEHIPEMRKSLAEVDVSNLAEGYCKIISMGGGASIASASDSAIIFNVEGEPVFSSGGVDIGLSLLPASGTVTIGHLEDPKGNTVTDKKIIMDQITEWSAGGTATVVGTTSRFYNTAGYVFVVKGVSTNVGVSVGASWTRYLGTKEEVIAS